MAPSVTDSQQQLGPHGLGDPNDRSLRKVEIEVLIPKKMREKAKLENCAAEVAEFNACCSQNGLTMVYQCREENSKMQDCLGRWFKNEEFRKICTDEYLNERSKYRATGERTGGRKWKRMSS